jgi:hypothetical protein
MRESEEGSPGKARAEGLPGTSSSPRETGLPARRRRPGSSESPAFSVAAPMPRGYNTWFSDTGPEAGRREHPREHPPSLGED